MAVVNINNKKPCTKPLVDICNITHYSWASADRTLFNKLPIGIVLIDIKTSKIIECNTEFERQSGRNLNRAKRYENLGIDSSQVLKFLHATISEPETKIWLSFHRARDFKSRWQYYRW